MSTQKHPSNVPAPSNSHQSTRKTSRISLKKKYLHLYTPQLLHFHGQTFIRNTERTAAGSKPLSCQTKEESRRRRRGKGKGKRFFIIILRRDTLISIFLHLLIADSTFYLSTPMNNFIKVADNKEG